MKKYNKFFEDKLKIISKNKKILDVGGGKPFQKYLKKYQSWFKNSGFQTLDCNNYYKPTILGDIHDIPAKDNSYDAILCLAVLEHVDNPIMAVKEIYRILKNRGCGLFFVPSIYPHHAKKGEGGYNDNYRFFDDGLMILFKDFRKIQICKDRGYLSTLALFLPNPLSKFLMPLTNLLDNIFKTRKKYNTTSGYYIFVIK